MPVELRLRSLLGIDRPGHTAIKDLAEEMGLSPFQLNSLLNNATPTINRENLERVINYLKSKRLVSPADLPEALFTYEPSRFWQMVSERKHILISMGVRWDPSYNANVVMAADSMLQSNLLYRLTGVGDHEGQGRRSRRNQQHQVIDSRMVLAWVKTRGTANKRAQHMGAEFYEEYKSLPNNKALICLGSLKSNPAIEPLISNSFKGLRAFRNEDRVNQPRDRGCPFVMVVRKDDPKPPSNSCGLKLSREDVGKGPGVYYEMEAGRWEYARCGENHDVAIVFYRLDRVNQNLEMVLGGFSGYSTRLLARLLREEGYDLFWPPSYSSNEVMIGLSVVKFGLAPTTSKKKLAQPEERWESTEVVDVPREAIARRLD
jgi:hypothetical protein